MKLTKL